VGGREGVSAPAALNASMFLSVDEEVRSPSRVAMARCFLRKGGRKGGNRGRGRVK